MRKGLLLTKQEGFCCAQAPAGGGRKIQKILNFALPPKATIGTRETLRFPLNSPIDFVELFSKIEFSKNLVQIRSKLGASGPNLGSNPEGLGGVYRQV